MPLPVLSQGLALNPSLSQRIELLSASQLELSEILYREVQANPLLEDASDRFKADPPARDEQREAEAEQDQLTETEQFESLDLVSYIEGSRAPSYDRRELEPFEPRSTFERFGSLQDSLWDYLNWQLNLINVEQGVREIARFIIGNLDENGYLTITLEEISHSLKVPLCDVEAALGTVQSLDPVGVGSRDLRECLLLQSREFGEEDSLIGILIRDYLNLIFAGQIRDIAKRVGVRSEEVARSLNSLHRYSRRPGQAVSSFSPVYIQPDVCIKKVGNAYQSSLIDNWIPRLRIAQSYRNLLQQTQVAKETKTYIRKSLDSAIELLRSVDQRNSLIDGVCQVIVRHQRQALESGIGKLRVLQIKDVADELGVHPSTVSRVVANKYAETPWGIIRLRRFFTSGRVSQSNGNFISNMQVKDKLKKLIENEDPHNPLSDKSLVALLNRSGVQIAVRTLAKYRSQMRIPNSFIRKKLSA